MVWLIFTERVILCVPNTVISGEISNFFNLHNSEVVFFQSMFLDACNQFIVWSVWYSPVESDQCDLWSHIIWERPFMWAEASYSSTQPASDPLLISQSDVSSIVLLCDNNRKVQLLLSSVTVNYIMYSVLQVVCNYSNTRKQCFLLRHSTYEHNAQACKSVFS